MAIFSINYSIIMSNYHKCEIKQQYCRYLLEHSSPTIMSIIFLLEHYGCVQDTFSDDCQISGVYENACCICMRILVYTPSAS